MTINLDNEENSFQYRVSYLIDELGGVSEVQKLTGLSRASLFQYKNGTSNPNLETLIKLARVGNVSVGWLANGEGKVEDRAKYGYIHSVNAEVYDVDNNKARFIKEMDVTLSAGSGSLVEKEDVVGGLIFYEDGLDEIPNINDKNQLIIVSVSGDSMENTVHNNDKVMVDLSQNTMKANGVYAISFDNNVLIKRLHQTIGGGIDIISDNQMYSTISVKKENLSDLRIIGRVVWVGKNF